MSEKPTDTNKVARKPRATAKTAGRKRKRVPNGPRPECARDVDVFRHSRSLMLAPNLFGLGGKKSELMVTTVEDPGGTMRIHHEPLDAFDLRVLCSIIVLSSGLGRGEAPVEYLPDDNTQDGQSAWEGVGGMPAKIATIANAKWRIMSIRTSRQQLLEVVSNGLTARNTNGERIEELVESLARLARVQIRIKAKDKRGEFISQLIYGVSRQDEYLGIILNPQLVAAVIDRANGHFSMMSMRALRALRGEVAPVLYQRLCATIDAGKSLRFNEDTLMQYIWRKAATTTREKLDRRRWLLAALHQIETLDPPWEVKKHPAARSVMRAYTITRPVQAPPSGQLPLALPAAPPLASPANA